MAIIAAGRHPKKRGAPRMKEFGYKQVQLWFDAKEAALVVAAAEKAGKKLATWIRHLAVNQAMKK